jgi:bifunctional UDP-N-acetylglucosamine pyrophosphorylase / glucosamine-1-phosphate N-acetyltransferase
MDRLMIIPAAGLGSRLQSSTPKILFPVNGRPMIDYLFDLYSTLVERFILVLHPSFEEEVRQHCASHSAPTDYELQESPTGMLDATLIPKERVQRYQPTSVWITWCDQITVHPETILNLAELSSRDSEMALIFPTVIREKPYIHLVRNEQNDIIDILHRREGDDLPEVGESDVGLFCLSRNAYLNLLTDFSCGVGRGTVTQERNFLPFIPWLCERAGVQTFPGRHEIESVGINTAVDLNRVERYLRHEGKNLFNYYSRL